MTFHTLVGVHVNIGVAAVIRAGPIMVLGANYGERSIAVYSLYLIIQLEAMNGLSILENKFAGLCEKA